jgi:DmsE family decaheme c-type cytochrome
MTASGQHRTVVWAVAIASAAAISTLLLVNRPELSAQDHSRVSEVCLDCHDDRESSLRGTPHQVVLGEDEKKAVACTDCHPGDARHYEDDPEEYAMAVPEVADAWNEAQICSQCHQNSHQQNMKEANVHVANQVNCSSCHRIHGVHGADSTLGAGQYPAEHYTGLLKTNQVDLCLDCHTSVRGDFAKSTHHPVEEGVVTCSECHMTLDRTKKAMSFGGTTAVCVQCHNEFQMPFPYEHAATVDYSVEEGACLNCHEPHGSHLPRLLKQPYEAPHYQLCAQCHSVPKHNFNVNHGSQWAGVPCNDCHVDIHGSFNNRLYLTPALQSQGCFNVGCHQL